MALTNDIVKTNGNPQEENNNSNNGSNEAIDATTSSAAALHSQTGTTTVGLSPGLYGGYGSSYGLGAAGGMYGSGAYGGYGGYGGGMMGMSDPMMFGVGGSGLGHPGITNILFNFQSLVFSLGQTIQIVSMNSQALKHMFVSSKQMIQQSIVTFGEMRQQFETFVLEYDLSSMLHSEEQTESYAYETKEELIKKRKLKAIRWTMAFALSVLGYKIAKFLIKRIFQNRQQHQRAMIGEHSHNPAPSHYYNAGGGGDLYNQHQGYYYNNPSSSQQYYRPSRW